MEREGASSKGEGEGGSGGGSGGGATGRKVLVGIDGSDLSQRAFARALELATHPGDQIILLTVIEAGKFAEKVSSLSKSGPEEGLKKAQAELQHEAEAVLQPLAARCQAKQLGCTLLVKEALSAKVEICEQAEAQNVDVLVIGCRGLGGLQKMLLGSVSEYCVSNAKCSVLVVR